MGEKRNNAGDAPGMKLGEPEPGIRYDGKLVRNMTDADIAKYAPQAQREFVEAQNAMRAAVEAYATYMAIANVLMFESERRTKKIRLPGELM